MNGHNYGAAKTPRRSRWKQDPEDTDQFIVQTDFGKGIIIRTRKRDGIKEICLFGGDECSSSADVFCVREPHMLYTPKDYPSVPPCLGDNVICQYGRGILTGISSDGKYSIELSSWRLGGRSTVTCYVTTTPKVVRKHTLSEMDATERVALAQSLKVQATKYFAEKDYASALNTYASSVDKVRNVQHDHTSTNEVRADLLVIMITCSNNAATCCIKLEKWEEASKFAKNALILLDALYGKRGMKIHTILNKEGVIDAKLFGEWRVKSYLVVARACMEQGEVADAVEILKKALDLGLSHIEVLNSNQFSSKEERSSLRALTSQMKEVKRLIAECSERKKTAKKIEKKKAKVMAKALLFGYDGKENASPNDEKRMKEKKSSETKQPAPQAENSQNKAFEDQTSSSAKKRPPYTRRSSLKSKLNRGYPSVQQSVSFSDRPPEVKEFERTKGNEDESPWYSEHKEALLMIGIAGFSVLAFVGLRKVFK